MMTATQKRIMGRWNKIAQPSNNILQGGGFQEIGLSTYSGSSITDTTSDFLGDWRSADSWMRFDMYRVRNRSRQLARGNKWVRQFTRNLRQNVLGHKGFHCKPMVVTGKEYGDANDGIVDEIANSQIKKAMLLQGQAQNMTTRKGMTRRDLDNLIVTKLPIDGEIILRKIRGYDNETGFAWQLVDPDYLDVNLNRVEPNGNLTKMGVELDKDYKFPVAYWLLLRRPNDYIYNYSDFSANRYVRVPAEEIIHIYVQDDDSEQTRGWPWIFAAVVNLFRTDKFEEAALVNATIGASKGIYYTKEFPDGFEGDASQLTENGAIIDAVSPGMSVELPYGVKPVQVDMRYPDENLGSFQQAMMLGNAAVFGTSYATTSGDLSQANFVSSRLGQLEEREFYMGVQEFLIEKWKRPGYDEELYRAFLSRGVTLPISKFDKFNKVKFTGRRWPFVQPVQDMTAKTMALDNLTTSISDIIEETTGESGEDMFKKIAGDELLLEKYGLKRIHSSFQYVEDEHNPDPNAPKPPATKKKDGEKGA